MFLSVHTCTGAIIGKFSPNPIVAFFLGILSHFILDIIPHGDMKVYDAYRSGKILRRSIAIIFLDGICAIYIAILALLGNNRFGDEACIAAGVAGAAIPDVLAMLYEVTRLKFLRKIHSFHFSLHRLISAKIEIPYSAGIFYQIVVLFYLLAYIRAF